jgi:gonadotropin-releasing hormone receptor
MYQQSLQAVPKIALCLQLVIFHVEKGPFYEDFYQCVTFGFYTEPWQEQLYTTFSLVCMFILPLLILISTYVSTIITISSEYKLDH